MAKPERKVHGLNIYLDNYGNYVYYNFLNKKCYVIEQEDEPKFMIMKDRFIYSFIIFILFAGINLPTIVSVGALAAVLLVFEIYFRCSYLPKLKVYSDTKRVKRVLSTPSKADVPKQIVVLVLYIIFAILLGVNAYIEGYDKISLLLTGAVIIIVIFKLILTIYGMFHDNKERK